MAGASVDEEDLMVVSKPDPAVDEVGSAEPSRFPPVDVVPSTPSDVNKNFQNSPDSCSPFLIYIQVSSEYKMCSSIFEPPPLQPKRNMLETSNFTR